jgi:hypothetical protein
MISQNETNISISNVRRISQHEGDISDCLGEVSASTNAGHGNKDNLEFTFQSTFDSNTSATEDN